MKWFFNSDTSIIDSTRPEKAAEDINQWYAKETENHITNLYKPSKFKIFDKHQFRVINY